MKQLLLLLMLLPGLLVSLPARADGASLYVLPPMQLQDQTGHRFALSSLKGQPVLMGMFYGSCSNACPVEIGDLTHLQDWLETRGRPVPRVILFSFDPQHDTVKDLAMVARMHHLDARRFTLARIDAGDPGLLGGVLGISWHRLAGGNFQHNVQISWVDAEGHILAQDPASAGIRLCFVNAIMKTLAGKPFHCAADQTVP